MSQDLHGRDDGGALLWMQGEKLGLHFFLRPVAGGLQDGPAAAGNHQGNPPPIRLIAAARQQSFLHQPTDDP